MGRALRLWLAGGCWLAACAFESTPVVPQSGNLSPPASVSGSGSGGQPADPGPFAGGGSSAGNDPATTGGTGAGTSGQGGTGAGAMPGSGGSDPGSGGSDPGSGGSDPGSGGAPGVPTEFCSRTENDHMPCDDAMFCTTGDSCVLGVCQGSPTDCSALDGPCQQGLCNEWMDRCDPAPAKEAQSCDDGLYCTVGERCTLGVCGGGLPKDCSVLDETCVQGKCDELGDRCTSVPAPNGQLCNDGLSCTSGDQCIDGVCSATACPPGAACTVNCPDGCACNAACEGAFACQTNCTNGEACTVACSDADGCKTLCPSDASCDADCRGVGLCELGCPSGGDCHAVCTNATACDMTCESGSGCEVDCRDAGICAVDCQNGAQCLLRCSGSGACAFEHCQGSIEDCDDGIQVCGRNCP